MAAAGLPKRPVGKPGICQLLGGVQEVVWDRDVLSGKSLGAHGRKQEVGGQWEGRTLRINQLQGSWCLSLQKKSQKRRFREEPDDEEAEAGTCSQYRGKSCACAQSGAP